MFKTRILPQSNFDCLLFSCTYIGACAWLHVFYLKGQMSKMFFISSVVHLCKWVKPFILMIEKISLFKVKVVIYESFVQISLCIPTEWKINDKLYLF